MYRNSMKRHKIAIQMPTRTPSFLCFRRLSKVCICDWNSRTALRRSAKNLFFLVSTRFLSSSSSLDNLCIRIFFFFATDKPEKRKFIIFNSRSNLFFMLCYIIDVMIQSLSFWFSSQIIILLHL